MKVAGVGRRIVLAALIGGVPAVWAFALAAPAGALPSGCSQVQRTVTCTFGFTGTEQTFSVPAGIGSVQIDAVGAPGAGSAGGLGGSASATVPVTSGETLYVEVGGPGTGALGGFNGGGTPDTNASTGGTGGGGGASDVRTSSGSLGSRLVVAGGGGGSGAFGLHAGAVAHGGAGGADGSPGGNTSSGNHGGGPGLAGTGSGGAGGAGGTAASGGTDGASGTMGVLGLGGNGGGDAGGNTSGGGGGGGYYGGGGGGGGGFTTGDQGGGGGGGGGSCFALAPVACSANSSTTPSVTITYTLPDTTAPTISISSPTTNAVYSLGATVIASYSCADEAGGSGLASCEGSVPSGGAVDTSTAGAHTFTVTARDNAGNPATQTVGYTVVAPTPAAPSISILSPIGGHTYKTGQRVRARYTCTEGAFGPGIKSCTGTVRSGGLINTQSLGRLKFTVTAVSNDGQTSSKTMSYSVRAPRVVSSPSYVVSIEGQQSKWVFTKLVAFNQPQQSCTHSGPLRVCQNGRGKPASFTLRAPLTDDTTLLSWKQAAKNSPEARETIVLEEIIPTTSLKSKTGTTTLRWRLTRAWPSKITVTGNRTIATVTVTFRGTALTRLNP